MYCALSWGKLWQLEISFSMKNKLALGNIVCERDCEKEISEEAMDVNIYERLIGGQSQDNLNVYVFPIDLDHTDEDEPDL